MTFRLHRRNRFKHKMNQAAVHRKLYQCLMCSERGIYRKIPGCHYVLQWVNANKNMERDSKHRWKDKFLEGQHLRRMADVDKLRTLI